MPFDIKSAFQLYKRTSFLVDTDLNFWTSVLNNAVNSFKGEPSTQFCATIFTAYNIEAAGPEGFLTDFKGHVAVTTKDLESKKQFFLSWVCNLTTLKLYNAVEVFFLHAIWLRYYGHLKNPITNKKNSDTLLKAITTYLDDKGLAIDRKNNRYLIEFLKNRSSNLSSFFGQKMRVDLETTWSGFFELFSILRNIIAHQGTIVSVDLKNEIFSKAKDLFNRYFKLVTDIDGNLHLTPIIEQYGNFILLINYLALNTVKFVFDEKDFKFLE